MDSRSSRPRHSFAGRLSTTTAGNNRGLGSSSSSISSRSTVSRPRICYVCEEAEQLPTKALVGCVTCKKLWHHNCHSPPITRDIGNLQKSFTCDRCLQIADITQNSPVVTAPISHPVSKRCVISGCPKIPSKDPITGIMMCKNHNISEKHRLSSSSSRPKVAIKTARVDRSKVNKIQKPEDRELLTGYKRRRTSTKKRHDSTGSEIISGQSKLEKRKSYTTESNTHTEASPQQLENSFVHDRYRSKTPPTTESLLGENPKAKTRRKTPPASQSSASEPPVSNIPKAKKQLSEWIARHCGEDLLTSLQSWIVTQTNTNIHVNNEKEWWLKLRDLFWTANSEKLVKEAINALNKAIRYRMDVKIEAHSDNHPPVLPDTRSMLQVKQGDIERAIERMEGWWKEDTHHYGDVERQFKEWRACYHACGIIVHRDQEIPLSWVADAPKLTTAPILLDDDLIGGIEGNDDCMNYEPPSPEPITDLLDREETRASQKAKDMEAPKETAPPADASISPSVGIPDTAMLDAEDDDYTPDHTSMPSTKQLAGIALEKAQAATDQLPALASKSPVQDLAAAFDDDDDLYDASPPRPFASTMSLERKVDHRSSSHPDKSGLKMPEAPSDKPMDIATPEPMDTFSTSAAPLAPHSLAGTGYTWEAPKGSLEANRRARSLLPQVTARVDKWFPPPKNSDSEMPVDTPSPVGNGFAKKKQKQKKRSKALKTDEEFRESQVWAHIDPTKIYPRPRMTPEQLAIKRAEIKANPPGKERKANFGIVFTERFKARRRAMGCSIYHLNIRDIDDGPEDQEHTKNLANLLNIEGIDNYEPFDVKGVEGICMREMVGTKIKVVVRGEEIERVKREDELKVISDDRRHILFTYFRGF